MRAKTQEVRQRTAGNQAGREELDMYKQLVLVREFEETCRRLWESGEKLVGEFHLSVGQEAIAVGVCWDLAPGDLIVPSIRGMGVFLVNGTPLRELFACFFDRKGGLGNGRWAHHHMGIKELGILAQNGFLGSAVAVASGAALAQSLRKTGNVAVCCFGDGVANTGYFHESLNFAGLRRLPVVFVCENNGYAVSTRMSEAFAIKDVAIRAKGYGFPGVVVDGNDVLAVRSAVAKALRRARSGEGPSLLECKTYRWYGQTLKTGDKLRPRDEVERAKANCPVARLEGHLRRRKLLDDEQVSAIRGAVVERIEEAIEWAKAQPPLDGADIRNEINFVYGGS